MIGAHIPAVGCAWSQKSTLATHPSRAYFKQSHLGQCLRCQPLLACRLTRLLGHGRHNVMRRLRAINSPIDLQPVMLHNTPTSLEPVADPYGYFPRDELQISPWVWLLGVGGLVFVLVKLDLLGVKVEVKPYQKLMQELQEEKLAAMRERGEVLTAEEYNELMALRAAAEAKEKQGQSSGLEQDATAQQEQSELAAMAAAAAVKPELPDDDMGRIVLCAALTGRQTDVEYQKEYYSRVLAGYREAFGANITGMLLLYPHCMVHILEADCHVLFDLLRCLSPARQGQHQLKLEDARILQFEPGITSRSFPTWSASFMSFAKPASAGVVLDTDKWVQAAKDLKASVAQVQNVMRNATEDKVAQVAADLKSFVPDLPDSQTVLSLAVTEEAENIELFLEYFDWDYDQALADEQASQEAKSQPIPGPKPTTSPFAHLYPKKNKQDSHAETQDQSNNQTESGGTPKVGTFDSSDGETTSDQPSTGVPSQPAVVNLSSRPANLNQAIGKRRRPRFSGTKNEALTEDFSRLMRNAESRGNIDTGSVAESRPAADSRDNSVGRVGMEGQSDSLVVGTAGVPRPPERSASRPMRDDSDSTAGKSGNDLEAEGVRQQSRADDTSSGQSSGVAGSRQFWPSVSVADLERYKQNLQQVKAQKDAQAAAAQQDAKTGLLDRLGLTGTNQHSASARSTETTSETQDPRNVAPAQRPSAIQRSMRAAIARATDGTILSSSETGTSESVPTNGAKAVSTSGGASSGSKGSQPSSSEPKSQSVVHGNGSARDDSNGGDENAEPKGNSVQSSPAPEVFPEAMVTAIPPMSAREQFASNKTGGSEFVGLGSR